MRRTAAIRGKRWAAMAVLFALAGAVGTAEPDGADAFRRDVRALCRAPHRLAGTEPARAAAGVVEQRLRELGYEQVIVQRFQVPQCRTDCRLEVGGQTFPLHAVQANFWQASVSGREPIRGMTVRAGEGEPADYESVVVKDRIVLLDYETARRWRDAFAMGARAVIFIETGAEPESFARHEMICADLPRFFMTGEDAAAAGLLEGSREITIHAEARWETSEACNVLAWLPGSNPVFSMEAHEAVVLSAQLDTFGEVPDRIQGAQGAANCAALLETADWLRTHPPRRSVLLAFLGAEGRMLAGSAALYDAVFRFNPYQKYTRTHRDFIDEYRTEQAFLREMIDAFEARRIFVDHGDVARRVANMLRLKAEHASEDVRTLLRALRLEQVRQAARETEAEIARLEEREAYLNTLRRALAKGELPSGESVDFDAILQACIDDLNARLDELDRLMSYREDALVVGEWLNQKAIVMHLASDFNDRGPTWGISIGEFGSGLPGSGYNSAGYYVALFGSFEDSAEAVRETNPASLALLELDTTAVRLGPPLFFPASRMHGGLMAARFGIYGLRFGSCHDRMPLAGHPHDDLERVDVDRIAVLARDARPLIEAALSEPAYSLRQRIRPTAAYEAPEWAGDKARGYNVMVRGESAALATRPAGGAMLGRASEFAMPAFDRTYRTVVDQNGNFAMGPLPVAERLADWCAARFDRHGRIDVVNSRVQTLERIELFPCRQYTVVNLAEPSFAAAESLVLNAMNDGQFRATDFYKMESPRVLTFFAPSYATAAKVVNPFGLTLLNASEERPQGKGLWIRDAAGNPPTEPRCAQDLIALNAHRLGVLRERRIHKDAQEWMHGLAKASLEKADAAAELAGRYASIGAAKRLAQRVYKPLLGTMNDLVKAVVILLLLTIPFAYALERLLVGTPHIYRQIAWYVAFFVLTFTVLYHVHPAFSIAAQPVIIFLAFVVILLSAVVIVILLSRFRTEIKAVQGMQTTVHAADVSRAGTFMAAVTMGISTMRRRPVRTLLTTLTVILLTFSILSFASFETQQGILRRYVNSTQETRSLFVHNTLWKELPAQLLDIVERLDPGVGQVTARRWLAPLSRRDVSGFGILVARADGRTTAEVNGMVGLDPADLERQPALGRALAGEDQPDAELSRESVFLSAAVATQLEIGPGDALLVRGMPLTVAGIFDERSLMRFSQIDVTPVFPVDYTDPRLAQQEYELEKAEELEGEQASDRSGESAFLPYLSANQVIFGHTDTVKRMGGKLVAISAYPDEESDLEAIAEKITRVSPAPVFVSLPDGVYRLLYTTILETSGMGNLVIPIILGGLIVFGTMLGSVTDREREIYSFSALGLAPPHIGLLFFAEAAVYAVIGGLGGYILSQAVVTGASWLSRLTNLQVPDMNFSSTNAIFAILVVMGTVMLSTVYPAMRASRSANPGLARRWQLPRPSGDLWEFTFPFTVSEYDVTGVMAFLLEHFENFSDCSLGVFLAQNTQIAADGRTLTLSSDIATAPFDLGVTETFQLTSLPSEIEGVDEVRITIQRRSGTRGDWVRTNQPFISDLRKQFLIWRSLPVETMELYRSRTLAMLGRTVHAKDQTNGEG